MRASRFQLPAIALLTLLLLLAGCGPRGAALPAGPTAATPTAVRTVTEAPVASAVATASPTATLAPPATPTVAASATPTPAPTPSASATPLPTATPDPYAGLSIPSLRQDLYGDEGEIEIVEELTGSESFRRYRIAFPSDGLRVEGFMNVPTGEGPFPVVIVNHGYMPTNSYELLTYTTGYADAFAQAGFLTIHPSYRNHRGSDSGENPWRIGYARDVMHLIVMARRLPQADGGPVGLWGHSMGGGITLRVLAVMPDQVGAAVLYGSMNGNEAENYAAIMRWTGGVIRPGTAMSVSPQEDPALYAAISPIHFLDGLAVPIQIHHGTADETVPFAWSQQLDERLSALGVPHELFAYEGGPHNLAGEARATLTARTIDFFDRTLQR